MTARKILVASDFSKHSDKALAEAMELAARDGAQVILLHVVPDEIVQCVEMYCLEEEQMLSIEAHSMQSARAQLAEQIERLSPAKSSMIEPIVESGTVYEKILDVAQAQGVDLVVLGAHGRKGLSRFLIGSTARNVLKGAASSVLVVR